MIRTAISTDFVRPTKTESDVRIASLRRAYGENVPFVRYYSDGAGGMLSIMDGVAVFSPCDEVTEEWHAFICMNPDIQKIHCDAEIGQALCKMSGWICRCGTVLRYDGEEASPSNVACRLPSLPAVYDLLVTCFDTMPSLNAWYPDASHRIRHGCCHIASVVEDGTVVSTAMTVAEADDAVILGQVATADTHRRRGLAANCIRDVISQCKVDTLYILPVNEAAERLYRSLGFIPCGGWAELERT